MYICIGICVFINIHGYGSIHVVIFVYICTYEHKYICTSVCEYVYVNICRYVSALSNDSAPEAGLCIYTLASARSILCI